MPTPSFYKRIVHILQAMLMVLPFGCAQNIPADKPNVKNPEFDQRLQRLLRFSTPLYSVQELHEQQDSVYILDTRSREEFEVSHIPGARYLGYRNLQESTLEDIPKEAPIVLYCSVGYRSEKIGNRLREQGYSKVYNLYGSIFEWVNAGYPLVDPQGSPTDTIHTYNRNWSRWVNQPTVKKTW